MVQNKEEINLTVKVVPQASRNQLKKEGNRYKLYLQAPAVDGKANKALIAFLAKYFRVRKNQIRIIKGLKSREKVIRIGDVSKTDF